MLSIKPTRKFVKVLRREETNGKFDKIELNHYEYRNTGTSINDIEKLARNLRKKILTRHLDADIQLIIETPFAHQSGKFRSAPRANIKDREIPIWNPEDMSANTLSPQDSKVSKWYNNGKAIPKSFYFNVIFKETKGGSDDNNDCLYNCLEKLLPVKLKDKWKYPKNLKTYLKIKRNDMINANEHMDKIEQALKVQIFISGDITRIPKINAQKSVKLILQNSHFSIQQCKPKINTVGISHKDRKPITYHYDNTNENYILYDGNQKFSDTVENIQEEIKKPLSSNNIYIKVKDINELEHKYNEFIKEADYLKEETNGLINMYRTGEEKTTSLYLFNHFTKAIDQSNDIDSIEGHFINECYRGGLLYSTPYKGEAYKYDVSSMYPSIMKSKMTFPYKEGKFITLTQSELESNDYFKYGIYRAVISGKINKALFRINENNHYTHIELELAKSLGYTISLIEDGTNNFLYYDSKTRISGTQLFGDYINLLYPIKSSTKDFKYSKKLLNILWGRLCQKNKRKIYTILECIDDVIIKDNEQFYSATFIDEDNKGNLIERIDVIQTDNMFVSGFARIGPFITAQGRKMISNLITNNLDDLNCVKRVYTDSIVSSVPLKNKFPNKEDADIGELGYEGYTKQCNVINLRCPEGEFKI